MAETPDLDISPHHLAILREALADDPASAGPLAIRVGLLIGGDVADVLAAGLVARVGELDEDTIADLHLHVVRERQRRVAEPERLEGLVQLSGSSEAGRGFIPTGGGHHG